MHEALRFERESWEFIKKGIIFCFRVYEKDIQMRERERLRDEREKERVVVEIAVRDFCGESRWLSEWETVVIAV